MSRRERCRSVAQCGRSRARRRFFLPEAMRAAARAACGERAGANGFSAAADMISHPDSTGGHCRLTTLASDVVGALVFVFDVRVVVDQSLIERGTGKGEFVFAAGAA